MSAAIAYKPDKSQAALVFDMQSRAYNTESLIEFLEKFHRHSKERRSPSSGTVYPPIAPRP